VNRIWLFALTLLFVQSAYVAASDLSVVAGRASYSDLENSGGDTQFKESSLFGVRYEKDFLFIVGFENSLLVSGNTLSPDGTSGEKGLYYTGNLVLNFPVDRVVPNLAVGVGVLHRFGETYPNIGTAFLSNWGFGVKFRNLAGPAGFRVDYRRIGIHGVENQTVTEQEFSGGLMLTF